MAKYIDADKLIAIINDNVVRNKKRILTIIDSLQQERPSLPGNLDEAAEEYAYNNWEDNDYHTGASEGLPFDAIGHTEKCFKAGAEWMAGQMKLAQPEVDLEEEIENYYGVMPDDKDKIDAARHFYELGLKAKEESK